MKKNVLGLISILFLVILVSGCTSSDQNQTKKYNDSSWVTFNYTTEWNASPGKGPDTSSYRMDPWLNINKSSIFKSEYSGQYLMAGGLDYSEDTVFIDTKSPDVYVTIIKRKLDTGMTPTEFYNKVYSNLKIEVISESNRTVDGITAGQKVYLAPGPGHLAGHIDTPPNKDDNFTQKRMDIYFEKNGYVYTIICGAPPEQFDQQLPKFEQLINSLKINN